MIMHMRVVLGAMFALIAAEGVTQADQPRFRNEAIQVDPVEDVARDARTGHISHILFVNRCVGDCVITPGTNDSRANTSNIIGGTTRTLSEFNLGDDVFNATIECLRDVYSPYDVQIVTEDPGDELHHEAILAGDPEEVERDPLTGGIAPASCEPLNNVISFSFANGVGENLSGQTLIETLCWTVAQESAHSFGLPNHVYDCEDPMTYLPGPCGRKYFRDKNIKCGRFEGVEPCPMCGVDSQNSHEKLLETFGPGIPVAPPEVTVQFPVAGSAVDDNFSIFFTAIDPRLIERADIYINRTKVAELPGKDFGDADEAYASEAPDHPDGYIEVEIRAYNDLAVEGTATVTVLKGEPCSGDSCGAGYECTDGHCVVVSDEGGGCCAVAGPRRDQPLPLVALGLFAAAILVIRQRRKRSGSRR
jgi:hypothetical protein